MFHEAHWRDDRHLFAFDVSLVHHTTDTAVVVGMGMRVDNCHHWPLAELCVDEIERCLGCFLGRQWVKDDPTGIALDKADIGEVEPTHLIDLSRHHLIEAIGHVQNGLPLQ